ncbi:NAD(P)-dependent oxidoreductase [Pseudalkalibacillus hwajinpoensis]|uniref:NAD(P)-dependent oxidoreductase n=1 Tax=Guptibacillus hwajinpoensis TaxID=208199 RepID=UPI001CD29716|nr:SDR family oxidoreductase [Pseudalkalibacillus hwajinpoensis]MCA0989839.1 SDR family oxidoreductase [Pseudalkalibacillus hwajinpoensis]
MNVFILGATGRVGSKVLLQAVRDHHNVSVLVRSPEKLSIKEGITIVEGDVLNEDDVMKASEGADVIISALGTDKTTTLSDSTPILLSVMKKQGIKRIITVGTAGILNSRTDPGVYRFESSESKRKTTRAAKEHLAVYEMLNRSQVEWTIICPTYLPEGDARGSYRVEDDYLPEDGKEISTGDTANFVYQELLEKKHLLKRVGIAY